MSLRRLVAIAVAAFALTAFAAAAQASRARLHVSRLAVVGGQRITISGNATGGCPRGSQLAILSKALQSRSRFAGVPVVTARVDRGGGFSTRATIAHVAPGLYSVTARCGGGNLGVQVVLSVTHR